MDWFFDNVVFPVGEAAFTYVFQPIGWAADSVVTFFTGII